MICLRHLLSLAVMLFAFAVAAAQTPPPKAPPTPVPTGPAGPRTPKGNVSSQSKSSDAGIQNPSSASDQDLSKVPLLTSQPRPIPPEPSMTRLGISAGNSIMMSLRDAIGRGLENNKNIEVARDNVRINEANLNVLEGVYDPVFQFTPLMSNTIAPTTGLLAGTRGAGTVSQTDLVVSPSVTKQFDRGGGEYQVFFNGLRRTTNSPFTLLSPLYSSNLGVTFVQPLMRNRSVDLFRRNVRIQRKRLSQSDAQFRQQAIDVISQVQQAYWELIFALRDQQNKLTTVNLAREQLRLIEARIFSGVGSPLERAEAQTQISTAETNLLSATQYVTVTENGLKQLLLPNSQSAEWSASILPTDQPPEDMAPINLVDALAEARANRPELALLRTQQEINKIDTDFYRNQGHPRVDLQATVSSTGLAGRVVNPAGTIANGAIPLSATGLTAGNGAVPLPLPVTLNQIAVTPGIGSNPGVVVLPGTSLVPSPGIGSLSTPGTSPAQANVTTPGGGTSPTPGSGAITTPALTVPSTISGGFSQQLRNLVSFDTRSVVVGVTIEIPFRNKAARANLAGVHIQEQQLAALAESTEEAIEAEVRNAAQTAETTRQQVLTTRAARESAEVQLAGERKLFQTGLSTTFLVFQRENQLSTARDTELRAQTDYNKALALLQRATSSTLRANNIIVDNPVGP